MAFSFEGQWHLNCAPNWQERQRAHDSPVPSVGPSLMLSDMSDSDLETSRLMLDEPTTERFEWPTENRLMRDTLSDPDTGAATARSRFHLLHLMPCITGFLPFPSCSIHGPLTTCAQGGLHLLCKPCELSFSIAFCQYRPQEETSPFWCASAASEILNLTCRRSSETNDIASASADRQSGRHGQHSHEASVKANDVQSLILEQENLQGHEAGISDVIFAPDGMNVASASTDGVVRFELDFTILMQHAGS